MMRKRIFTTAILALFAFTLAMGQSRHYDNWRYGQDRDRDRHHKPQLEQVLERNYNRGFIDRWEYRMLKKELRYLKLAKRVAKSDGRYTHREKKMIRAAEQDFLRELDDLKRDRNRKHRKRHH